MIRFMNFRKGSMREIFSLFLALLLLSGCAQSLALLGPASTSVTGGNLGQSAVSSSISYGVKKQTGKSPMEHVMAYAEQHNPNKRKEPCLSFVEKTNSEICTIVKKQISLTNTALKNKTSEIVKKYPKEIAVSIQTKIKKTSLIEDIAKKSVIYNRR